MLAQAWGKAEVQRREGWLKLSQAKSVGILWMTVSTWPVSAVVSEAKSALRQYCCYHNCKSMCLMQNEAHQNEMFEFGTGKG